MKYFICKLSFLCISILLSACGSGGVSNGNASGNTPPPTTSITLVPSNSTLAASVAIGTVIATLNVEDADGFPLDSTVSPAEYFEIVGNSIRTKKLLTALKDTTQVITVTVADKQSTTTESFNLRVDDNMETLLTLEYNIRQGSSQKITYAKPSKFIPQNFKIISKSDSALEVIITNPLKQELSIFYNGSAASLTLTYRVSNNTEFWIAEGKIKLNVALKDPLYSQQWGLKNTGQTAFSDIGGVTGSDINVESAHRLGYLGRGIKVAVVDQAVEIGHEDLKDNVVLGGSYDFVTNQNTPTVNSSTTHGTPVSGIILMKGWNSIGGMGVAPEAKLVSYNFIDRQTNQSMLSSLGYAHQTIYNNIIDSRSVSIFNLSYGSNPTASSQYGSSVSFIGVDIVRCGTTGNATGDYFEGYFNSCNALRDGKGANYIKAVGNGFLKRKVKPNVSGANYIKAVGNGSQSNCIGLNANLSCQMASGAEIFSANPFVINVGAFNADGLKSSYSSAGPVLWISAPGGESGWSNLVFGGHASWNAPLWQRQPAIISTDLSSCSKGFDALRVERFPVTTFDGIPRITGNLNIKSIARHPLNQNCNYTSRMNGSSSDAPMVSGVVALMLEANSSLTWRDVKYILAKTAKFIDSNKPAQKISLGGSTYVQQEAWRTNKAGYRFHNWYGFGAVNAGAAVSMASTYTNYLTNANFVESAWQTGLMTRSTIADNSIQGGDARVTIPATIVVSKIEGVQMRLTISSATPKELNIRLTSPGGMVSNLLHANSNLVALANDTLFYSNAFYGESPIGEWKLEVIDSVVNGQIQKLTDFKIRLFGGK